MKVSVIVPAYNGAKYLNRCLDSVLSQTYEDWECIVIDDFSSDSTPDIIKTFAKKDRRFRFQLRRPNCGVAVERNNALDIAKGDAILFLDQDDWLDRDAIETLAGEAESHPEVGWIFSPARTHWQGAGRVALWNIELRGFVKAEDPRPFSRRGFDFGHITGNLYIPSKIKAEFRIPEVVFLEDQLFNMGLLFAGTDFFVTDRIVYNYLRHEDSFSASCKYVLADAEKAHRTLTGYKDEYSPNEELYARCRAFLNTTIINTLSRQR